MQSGYSFDPAHQQYSNVAFFPLYPLVARLLSFVLPGAYVTRLAFAAILVSNAAALAAAILLYKLARLDENRRTAARAVMYLLIFPMSFFLSTVYSESLFLALLLAVFYAARLGKWREVGVVGFLLALTRPTGVEVLLPLAIEYWDSHGRDIRRFRLNFFWLLAIPLGLLAFCLFLGFSFHDPLAFMEAQARWNRRFSMPWYPYLVLIHYHVDLTVRPLGDRESWTDLIFSIIYLLGAAASFRWLRPSYAVLAAVLVIGPMMTGLLISIARFGLVAFPFYLLLSKLGKKPLVDQVLMPLSFALSIFFMVLWAIGCWVS
jgi:Gpi18-like mannosyltransferase